MHTIVKAVLLGMILVASAIGSLGQAASRDAHGSLIVVMKDGRRETIPVAEITKIEFKDADIVVFRDGGQKSFRMSETPELRIRYLCFHGVCARAEPFCRQMESGPR